MFSSIFLPFVHLFLKIWFCVWIVFDIAPLLCLRLSVVGCITVSVSVLLLSPWCLRMRPSMRLCFVPTSVCFLRRPVCAAKSLKPHHQHKRTKPGNQKPNFRTADAKPRTRSSTTKPETKQQPPNPTRIISAILCDGFHDTFTLGPRFCEPSTSCRG